MSFILDALKKSENERQRQTGPAFAEVPMAQPRAGQPWWVIAIGALLLVNLIVLMYVLFLRESPAARPAQSSRPEPTTAPAASAVPDTPARAPAVAPSVAVTPPPTPVAPPQTPAQRTASPPATASGTRGPTLAEAAGVDNPYDTGDPTLDYQDIDSVAAQVPAGPPIVRPLNQRAEPRDAPAEALPTLNDLMLSGSTPLPEMHLDIHVYGPVPAERFVFINMRKYVEGQKLQEGPVVERITRDGVVLNQQGLRFLLPSQ